VAVVVGAALGTLAIGIERRGDDRGSGSAVAPRLVVSYPGPGWRVASPRTSITFGGADVVTLSGIRVTGSRSGPHSGRVHALRSERGGVFTPDEPFAPGERVTVRTAVDVMGARGDTFSFTVSRPGGSRLQPVDLEPVTRLSSGPPTTAGIGTCKLRRLRFRTRPEFRPVGICVSRRPGPGTARGRIFLTPRSRPERRPLDQHSVMLLSESGRILWYSRRPNVARDLKTVRHGDRLLLAYYQWKPGGRSYYALLDSRYRVIKRIRARNGYRVNTHEFQLTPAGTAYLAAYEPVRLPGFRTPVLDFVVQEIDVETGDVLFEWHAVDHVPPSASYVRQPGAGTTWDYFHGNSIEPPASRRGTIIVSARNVSAVYGIDRSTGALRWTLGGKLDDFDLVERHPRRQFCAQHDARRQSNGDITIFDNGGPALGNMRDCPVHKARVQRFRLDLRSRTAHLVRTIPSEPSSETGVGYFVWAMGSAQRQRNGGTLINWGTTGRLTEVSPGGGVGFGLRLERYTYRAVRSPWIGLPRGRPAVAARRRDPRSATVWASWNGATTIRRWRVFAGASTSRLRPVGESFRFRAFEAVMRVATPAPYVAVAALDGRGAVLGRSRPKRVRPLHHAYAP
jgi:hypothetical protein